MVGTFSHVEDKAVFKRNKFFVDLIFYLKGYVLNKIKNLKCFTYYIGINVQEKHRRREH